MTEIKELMLPNFSLNKLNKFLTSHGIRRIYDIKDFDLWCYARDYSASDIARVVLTGYEFNKDNPDGLDLCSCFSISDDYFSLDDDNNLIGFFVLTDLIDYIEYMIDNYNLKDEFIEFMKGCDKHE